MAQTNFLTLKVNLRQNLNQRNQAAYQKYYAEVDSEKTLTTLGLAKHLKDHGCLGPSWPSVSPKSRHRAMA